MSKNFSLRAIAAVSGLTTANVARRARALGYITNRKGYTAEQAHSIIYYKPKKMGRPVESLEQETARLSRALEEFAAPVVS